MTRETWYVLDDGSVVDPREVKADAAGVLRHRDGVAVAMRGDVPRSRGVDVERVRAMKPAPQPGYATRDLLAGGGMKPAEGSGDLAAARAEYQTKFGKRAFAGWDAATLREKIAQADGAGEAESKADGASG